MALRHIQVLGVFIFNSGNILIHECSCWPPVEVQILIEGVILPERFIRCGQHMLDIFILARRLQRVLYGAHAIAPRLILAHQKQNTPIY